MGAVYRATDTKLAREVAIKVLPDAFAHDADRLSRFTREAQVLASLNHPNIASIFGIEEGAIVMELVEGPTLAERIERGAIPLEEALSIARQIAEALEAAHDKNVIHRDLKPANVKVTPEGTVKVLDFGLAKLTDPRESSENPQSAPTVVRGHSPTIAGMIMGTAEYMSPEQASGKPVDKRTDIWSFGVVLWEMLSGNRMFSGETLSHTLAGVLQSPIDFEKVSVPAPIKNLLRRCLDRDAKSRLRDIGEARLAIAKYLADPIVESPQVSRGTSKRGWAVAAILGLAASGLAFIHFRETPPHLPVLNATLLPPENTEFDFGGRHAMPAISPDGTRIVFGARGKDGKTHLWLRRLDSPTTQLLSGTESAETPFWSPDSRWVGFGQDGKLRKIDIQGGPPVAIADLAGPLRGGSWNAQGTIVLGVIGARPVFRVAAAGGKTAPVVDGAGLHPWFLPDGRHFLYMQGRRLTGRRGASEVEQREQGESIKILAGSIDEPQKPGKVVAQTNSPAVYAQGHLLYLMGNTLMAQPFDPDRLETRGDPVPVVEGVPTFASFSRIPGFAVSPGGLLVYQTGASGSRSRLVWKDRKGNELGTLGQPTGLIGGIDLSPDGKRLAASIVEGNSRNEDIWIYDVARGIPTRFTFDPQNDRSPVWSADGNTLYFSSNRKGPYDLFRKSSNGAGTEEILLQGGDPKLAQSVSPDGRWLLYYQSAEKTRQDIWLLPLTQTESPAKAAPRLFLQTPFAEQYPQFSPDGKWVAYQSNESGEIQVYAAPFPGPGGKRQISNASGYRTRWRRDGKEVFYVTTDGQLMAAEVTARTGSLEVGRVQKLFEGIVIGRGFTYDATADGQKFLVVDDGAGPTSARPLTLLSNWTATLKK